MPRSVIYQGDLDALEKTWAGKYIANGECARLPQELTDVGHTSRWQPGARVVDLASLPSGTVIANFVFENGKARYPNKHGWHAGLFRRFENGAMMSNGMPCVFSMIDQYRGKTVAARGLGSLTPAFRKAYPRYATPSNNADEFYVVMVP
jgi:hypothetical protein